MSSQRFLTGRDVYIVDGCRTPFLKARQARNDFAAADLAVYAGQALLLRQPFAPTDIEEVILGCVVPDAVEANIARVVELRLECGYKTPAWTVQRNCASGMQALDNGAQSIGQRRADLVLAGGTEAMSHAPMLFSEEMVDWLSQWYSAKSFNQRLRFLKSFRPHLLKPVFSLIKGLKDPNVGLSMGQTAEKLAFKFGISREAMDAYALRSHQRMIKAQDEHYLREVITIYNNKGQYFSVDDGARRDTTLEKLAKLQPFFDKKYGMVTPGNSSQVTDGCALLLLASADAVRRFKLPVIAKIVDVAWSAIDPSVMGVGPVYAATELLSRHGLGLNDIDYWEINEAFAAQVLACFAAWQDEAFCREALGLDHALGHLDEERVNIDGGAVSIGHPIGASGARIVLHLANILQRKQAKRGIASICIGGGQGGAMLIERVTEVTA